MFYLLLFIITLLLLIAGFKIAIFVVQVAMSSILVVGVFAFMLIVSLLGFSEDFIIWTSMILLYILFTKYRLRG